MIYKLGEEKRGDRACADHPLTHQSGGARGKGPYHGMKEALKGLIGTERPYRLA